jgi:hypothetical protein
MEIESALRVLALDATAPAATARSQQVLARTGPDDAAR